MAGWKERFERKQSLSRRAGFGAIPVATRMGTLWIEGAPKNCFGFGLLAVAAALHFGFVWPRISGLKRFWLAPLIVSLGAALVFFGLALGS